MCKYIFRAEQSDGTIVEHTVFHVGGPELTEAFFTFLAGCTFTLPAYPSIMADEAWNASNELPEGNG